MNRLWVRLSLYFSLFIIIGVFMVALLIGYLADFNGNDLETRIRGQLEKNLSALYTEHGNWTGVSDLLRSYDIIRQGGLDGEPLTILFADADGHILYDGTEQHQDGTLTAMERAEATPVTVNGVIQGYLTVQKVTHPTDSNPNFSLGSVLNGLLLFALVVGGLGVIAGIFISRQLTAPLSELAETVRTFRQPNQSKQATIKGTVEVREVATAFNEMADALAEAERLRRNLVGDVAHELRTPLTVLQANIQAMLDDLYPLNKTEIQNLQAQTDLLQRLVNDLHELAQAEARQLTLRIMSVNLSELVQSLVEHFKAITQPQGLILSTQLPDVPIRADVDPDRIAQVLRNLMQNAIVHTPEKGVISVALSGDSNNISIVVTDTGTGISAQDQKRIFERFYRTDQTRSRETGGAGLGLPIAKAIIEMHQGTIQVKSDGISGHGTTFTITLPITQNV